MNPNEDLILADFPFDKVLSYEETIARLLNFWKNRLVRRTVEYHAAAAWRDESPGEIVYTGINPQNGEKTGKSISAIMEARMQVVAEARHYVLVLEKIFAAAKEGDEKVLAFASVESIVAPEKEGVLSPIQHDTPAEDEGADSDGGVPVEAE